MYIAKYTQYLLCTIVINNVTVSEEGQAVFTCVLNKTNARDDVWWYRLIKDTNTAERVNQSSNINFTTSTINNTLTSSLTITNARRSYTGYYWVGTPSVNVCNISLTILTSMCIELIIHNAVQININRFTSYIFLITE